MVGGVVVRRPLDYFLAFASVCVIICQRTARLFVSMCARQAAAMQDKCHVQNGLKWFGDCDTLNKLFYNSLLLFFLALYFHLDFYLLLHVFAFAMFLTFIWIHWAANVTYNKRCKKSKIWYNSYSSPLLCNTYTLGYRYTHIDMPYMSSVALYTQTVDFMFVIVTEICPCEGD